MKKSFCFFLLIQGALHRAEPPSGCFFPIMSGLGVRVRHHMSVALNPIGKACHPMPLYLPAACSTHSPYIWSM